MTVVRPKRDVVDPQPKQILLISRAGEKHQETFLPLRTKSCRADKATGHTCVLLTVAVCYTTRTVTITP